MKSDGDSRDGPIDAVITWVDGADPAFRARFEEHQQSRIRQGRRARNATTPNPVRYEENGELRYCLRSIFRFAPWIRKVWIVTAGQFPLYLNREKLPDRVTFVDHEHIFRGFEDKLPNFNSEAIGSVLWRIDGLASKFIYFNDDTMLLRGAEASSFFVGESPIVQGRWREISSELKSSSLTTVNAARLMGFEGRYLAHTHVARAYTRELFSELFSEYPEVLISNLRHRFRSRESCAPGAAFAHYGVREDKVQLRKPSGNVIYDRFTLGVSSASVDDYRRRLETTDATNFCVNNLASFERHVPGWTDMMDGVFGPPLAFELPLCGKG